MKAAVISCRWVLCLTLSMQLGLPAGLWGAPETRGLKLLAEFQAQKVALWVLTIGVSQYADKEMNLEYADHDAESIAQLLVTQQGILFEEVHTRVLVNEEATRENILTAMSEFLGQASKNDVVLIFLAGHGLADRKTGTYYFVPCDADIGNLIYAGLPMPMFDEVIKRLQTHVDKMVLLNDTCHAGAVRVAARGVTAGEDLTEALSQAKGQYVLSASMSGEESLEDESYRLPEEQRGHGAFTYVLLQGLQGAAADTNGVVWISDLFGYVNKEVPKLTKGSQHPHFELRGTDLPLFVLDQPGQKRPTVSSSTGPTETPALVPEKRGSGKTWLWLFLGAAAAGGAGAVGAVVGGAGGGTEEGPGEEVPTGDIIINVPLPE